MIFIYNQLFTITICFENAVCLESFCLFPPGIMNLWRYVLYLCFRKVGQPQHAEGFLIDALKMFQREKWQMLADDTCLQLAQCQKLLNCQNKFPF